MTRRGEWGQLWLELWPENLVHGPTWTRPHPRPQARPLALPVTPAREGFSVIFQRAVKTGGKTSLMMIVLPSRESFHGHSLIGPGPVQGVNCSPCLQLVTHPKTSLRLLLLGPNSGNPVPSAFFKAQLKHPGRLPPASVVYDTVSHPSIYRFKDEV